MNKTTLRSLLFALAGVFALGLRAQAEDPMFYIGETGYASWMDVYAAAKAGDTIVVGENAVIGQSSGTFSKSVTIDLHGHKLEYSQGWLTGCSVAVVDTGAPAGQFVVSAYSMNVSGGTLDLSSLASGQVTGRFQVSGTTLLAFPGDRTLADCTSAIPTKAVNARIVVQGVTYTWNGTSWVSEGPGHDITITAPQNGTLATSVTNNVAAGTVVTVTATPAAGYRLASVTTNGAAIVGTTFEMPSEDVTLAATFAENVEAPHMFYIGERGYDSWTDAMNAASNGDTVSLGTDAEISGNQMKSLTIDLRGHTLTANTSNAPYIANVTSISVTDSAGGGLFTAPNGMNLQGTIDLSALTHDQFSIAGNRFWTGSDTVAKFPAGWTLDECKAKFRNSVAGAKIVAQGVTYTWNGSSWQASNPVIGSFHITPLKTKATVAGSITDAGTDATACDVYFALDGGAAAKIAEGATGSFEYQITGLTAGTTYAYVLSVSNNAPTAKGTVRSGTFTTLSPSDPTTEWATGVYMPNDWRALSDNVLANVKGTMDTSHQPNNYGTNDLLVLTDGTVPSQAGKDWIVGIQPTAEITWQLAEPVMLERLRISSCYLADPHFSGVNISSVRVKCKGSDEWVEVPGSSSGKIAGDGTTGNIVCATLSDAETGYIAQQVTTLKVVFGAAVYANANYYAEIEAVGHAEAENDVLVIAVQ